MSKLPSSLQIFQKVLHLKVDKKDTEFVMHLAQYAKKTGLYRRWWGTHVHPTEGVDCNSMPGDIKRAAKFALKSTKYNTSMTSIDVFGFLDLNDTIRASKSNGSILFTMTGWECLTTFLQFHDSSPLIAEVHQQVPLGSVSLVYPNTSEGEKLIIGLANNC